MTPEKPLEITYLPGHLHSLFDAYIPPAASGTADEKERNFCSRALAAFAIHKLAGTTPAEAAASIVDGGGDGGIDAIFHLPNTSTLYVVQSKYFQDGQGEPALGDVAKFREGVGNLLSGKFDAFSANASWNAIIPSLPAWFRNLSQVRVILVYSGVQFVSDDRTRMFESQKQQYSPDDDYYLYQSFNLTSVHDWVTGADEGPGVETVELTLLKPGWVQQPYETIYGQIQVSDLLALYQTHGKKLVEANIRGYKGNTEVNEKILQTLKDEPDNFFYLNNGLTAYCHRLEVNNLDRANAETKRITAHGFSIVNGAQTLGSISKLPAQKPPSSPNGLVLIKIISLERHPEEIAFASRVTQSTNFQNQIGLRDFVSLDPLQGHIARQLEPAGIHYHYQDDVDVPSLDGTNFDLKEATNALAAMLQDKSCNYIARLIANQRSLWSMEDHFPEPTRPRSLYHNLFRPEHSARTIWRAVQAQRIVVVAMKNSGTSETGVRKAFFENAKWLVLNLVFLKYHPERGEPLALDAAEESTLTRATQDFAEKLWTVCEEKGFVTRTGGPDPYQAPRHMKSVFSSAADCEILRNAFLAKPT